MPTVGELRRVQTRRQTRMTQLGPAALTLPQGLILLKTNLITDALLNVYRPVHGGHVCQQVHTVGLAIILFVTVAAGQDNSCIGEKFAKLQGNYLLSMVLWYKTIFLTFEYSDSPTISILYH